MVLTVKILENLFEVLTKTQVFVHKGQVCVDIYRVRNAMRDSKAFTEAAIQGYLDRIEPYANDVIYPTGSDYGGTVSTKYATFGRLQHVLRDLFDRRNEFKNPIE